MCAAGKVFEVIVVSRDRDQDGFDEYFAMSRDRDQKGFDEYFAMMPWLTIPFRDELINA